MAPNIGRVQQALAIELNSPRRNEKGSAAGPIPVCSRTVLAHSIIDWSHSTVFYTLYYLERKGPQSEGPAPGGQQPEVGLEAATKA